MIYVGIDPGVSGGLAFLNDAGVVRHVSKMPATERDLLELLHEGFVAGALAGGRADAVAMLERVNAGVFGHGKMGRMGAVSAFTFGRGYGAILMALTAARIPFDQVGAGQWQAAMGCRSGGDKNVTKRRAQQLFPSQTITHAIADALLLAEFCRRVRTGAIHGKEERQAERQGGPITTGEVVTVQAGAIGADAIRAAAAGRSARDGAGPERPARSSVRGDRGHTGEDERSPAARAERNPRRAR